VFELDNTRAHQFIWGYLSNYPAWCCFTASTLVSLRVAILASRAAVVADRGLAERLQARFPSANVRYAPSFAGRAQSDDAAATGSVKFAVFDRRASGRHRIDRAFERARHAGAEFEVLEEQANSGVLGRCDVVVAPAWPRFMRP
jgi:hypothetical protein